LAPVVALREAAVQIVKPQVVEEPREAQHQELQVVGFDPESVASAPAAELALELGFAAHPAAAHSRRPEFHANPAVELVPALTAPEQNRLDLVAALAGLPSTLQALPQKQLLGFQSNALPTSLLRSVVLRGWNSFTPRQIWQHARC
jgi:hypothetical protein